MRGQTITKVGGGGRKRLRVLLAGGMLGIALVILLIPGSNSGATTNDFVAYWSAARQVVRGENPYDTAAVIRIEREVGFRRSSPLVMRNPPWALPLVAPLGFLPLRVAQSLWLLTALAAAIVSVYVLSRLYLPNRPLWVGGIAAAPFLPLAVALTIGQISPFLLLGVAGVLHFAERRRFGLAGASMFLLALKPHLVWLLWLVLIVDSSQRRRRMLIAFTLVLVGACLLTLLIDHSAFNQYFVLSKESGLLEELTPTLGGLMRSWAGVVPFQFLPIAIVVVWFLYYWRRLGSNWQWREELPLLLLISLASASYSWFFDQVILLPCIFHAAASVIRRGTKAIFFSAASFLAINAAALVLILTHRTTFWYVWTTPAWLVWYLSIRAGNSRREALSVTA